MEMFPDKNNFLIHCHRIDISIIVGYIISFRGFTTKKVITGFLHYRIMNLENRLVCGAIPRKEFFVNSLAAAQ